MTDPVVAHSQCLYNFKSSKWSLEILQKPGLSRGTMHFRIRLSNLVEKDDRPKNSAVSLFYSELF